MENFVVSARKYRPQSFETVVGQESITRTLDNAIANNHLAQAFLFCGPRGVGKTTCARILAKKINASDQEDGNEDFSFNIFELDAASNNSVDDIRHLIDQVRIPPQVGNYRVYIIDEVHMLSAAAFNAFLKTLEEPPPHAIFILATTEKHKIIPTILSRCQIFDFKRIEIPDIIKQLGKIAGEEGVKADHDALHVIAQKADGAMRDALSIFDQIVSFCGTDVSYQDVIENLNVLDYDYYFKIGEAIEKSDIPGALMVFNDVLDKGFDGHNFINGLAEHFRNLLVCQSPQTLALLLVGENVKARYKSQSEALSSQVLMTALRIISKCDVQYKASKNQRLLVEIAIMQLCSINEALEKKKSNG
jgi:DNA polymerase-3 subunit gamma/tau